MQIFDELYGTFQLDEVLVELLASPEVQRLKDIHMIGPSYLLNPLWNETRYEHSVGVMLLVKKLGGDIEEQIAGLLHDVSHTIFSHVIDVVMDRPNEDYHEEIKEQFITMSSLPETLSKHGFDYKAILLDDSQWQILEQEAPRLCADRLDYTLREVHRYFQTDLGEIHTFLDSIQIIDNQIVLSNLQAGEWFIEQYQKIVSDLFYDPLNSYGYECMSDILSYCLKNKLLSKRDLMKNETEVLDDLGRLNDETLSRLFDKFYQSVSFKEVNEGMPYDIFQKKKMRLVDPLVSDGNKIEATSLHSASARAVNQEIRARGAKGIYLVIE